MFLPIIFFLFVTSCSITGRNDQNKINSWEVSFGDSTNWQASETILFDLSEIHGNTLYLRSVVPDNDIADPVLFIENSYQSADVFINDSLIYSFGDTGKNDIRVSRYWHMIVLPENCGGKKIVFRITSPIHLIGLSKHIFIGSSAEVYRKMIRNDLPKLFAGLFLIFFGIAASFLTVYLKQFKYYAGLISFVILFGIWLLFNPHSAQLYVDDPALLYYLDLPVLIISAASFFLFFSGFFIKPVDKVIKILSILHFAAGITLTISDMLGLVTIKQFGASYLLFLLLSNLFITVLIISGAIERKSEAKIIMTGAAVFLILASVEIVCFLTGTNMSAFGLDLGFVHIGATVLVLFWVVLYFIRYVKMNREYLGVQENFSKNLLDFQNEERKRIASELHDAAGHDFLVIKTLSQMGISEPDKVDIPDILSNISETSDNAVNNLRNICRALYPPVIENLGLRKALMSLTDRSFGNSAVSTEVDIDDIDNFFEKSDHIHVYRIVQELINNILKHSEAGKISIKVKRISGSVRIIVTDNGKGMPLTGQEDTVSVFSKGMGLKGISERTRILNGTMTVKNVKPSGTEIEMIFKCKM